MIQGATIDNSQQSTGFLLDNCAKEKIQVMVIHEQIDHSLEILFLASCACMALVEERNARRIDVI
jgi:hypothetical protein